MELNTAIAGMAEAEKGASRLSPWGLVSATLVGLVGAVVIFITPGFLALIAQKTGFNDDQLGYLAAWDINAMGVAIGLSTFALARVRWRLAVGVALGLIIAGNLLTAAVASFPALAAARVLAGAGEGIAIGFSFAALGRAANADRAFAIYLVVGALLSAAFLYALPAIQAAISPELAFVAFAVLTALVLPSLRYFPDGSRDEPDIFAGGGKLDWKLTIGALSSVFLLFFAISAAWSYSERIGQASALGSTVVANGLSLGTMAGVVGAGLAGVLPRRWGRSWPLTISGVTGVISFVLFMGHVSPGAFVVAAALLMFSWNFAQPLMSGMCAEACSRGRVVCAMGSIQTFGTGLGPAAGAATLFTGSFNLMLGMSAALLVLSVLIGVWTIFAEGQRAEH